MKLRHCLLASAAAASLVLPVEGRAATCLPAHDPEIVPLTPNGDGRFSARVTLGEGPASRTLDMIIDTGAAISGVPAGVANALIAAKQAVELPRRLLTLVNGAGENERTIGIITVTVDGTPLLGLPVLQQIGRFTIDAAHEQLILNESTQCKTPSDAALKEVDEAQAQVTEIMKAPMDSSKAQAPALPPAEEQKAENAPPAHDLTPSPESEPPADVTPHPENDTAEAAAPAAPAPHKTPVGAPLLKIEDLPQYKFAREVEHPPVTGGSAESRYLTTVYGMIKAHLGETPELHLEAAVKPGLIDFYVYQGGNLVGRKLVSSSGSPNLDSAAMMAIAAAAPYPVPPNWRPLYLNYNFGKRAQSNTDISATATPGPIVPPPAPAVGQPATTPLSTETTSTPASTETTSTPASTDTMTAPATQTYKYNKVGVADNTLIVGHFANTNPDCIASGKTYVRISHPASHGVVNMREGLGFSHFPKTPECNSHKIEGVTVEYVPEHGFTGSDEIGLDVIYQVGTEGLFTYCITIK